MEQSLCTGDPGPPRQDRSLLSLTELTFQPAHSSAMTVTIGKALKCHQNLSWCWNLAREQEVSRVCPGFSPLAPAGSHRASHCLRRVPLIKRLSLWGVLTTQIKPGPRSALCVSEPNSGSSSRKVVFPMLSFDWTLTHWALISWQPVRATVHRWEEPWAESCLLALQANRVKVEARWVESNTQKASKN